MHPRTGFGAWSCLNQGFLPCLRDRESANPSVALRPILSPAEASLRAEEPAETLAGQAQEGSFGPRAPAYPAVLGFKKKETQIPSRCKAQPGTVWEQAAGGISPSPKGSARHKQAQESNKEKVHLVVALLLIHNVK